MADHRVRAALPDPLGDQVEVVVLQQDQRLTAPRLDLLGDRIGELLR